MIELNEHRKTTEPTCRCGARLFTAIEKAN